MFSIMRNIRFSMKLNPIEEMNRIRDRLRSVTDLKALQQVADDEREKVQRFADDPETKVLAVIISNLKSYMAQVELPAMQKSRNS